MLQSDCKSKSILQSICQQGLSSFTNGNAHWLLKKITWLVEHNAVSLFIMSLFHVCWRCKVHLQIVVEKTPYNSMPICSIAYKPIIARWCTMMHLTSCFATGLEKQGKNTSKLLDLWPERWRKWYTTAKVFRDVMDCEGDIWRLHCEGRARTQSPLICKTSFWLPPAEGAKIIWRWDPALLH